MKQRKPAPAMYQPKAERTAEIPLTFKPCCVCSSPITEGYWGRWGDGGVCKKTCNEIMESRPKEYPDDPQRNRTATS